MPVLLLVVSLVAIAYWLFPGAFSAIPGQRWDPNLVTIKGFRAGVTRQQIEARLGPGTATEGGWYWAPPLNFKPGGPLPVITFERLTLCKYENRWCLSGSQFEYGSQKFVTRYLSPDSIEQRTVQHHFGPGRLNGLGDDLDLDYSSPDVSRVGLSFGINAEDGWPQSWRRITRTTLSWPAESQARGSNL